MPNATGGGRAWNDGLEGRELPDSILVMVGIVREYLSQPSWPNVSLRQSGAAAENAGSLFFAHLSYPNPIDAILTDVAIPKEATALEKANMCPPNRHISGLHDPGCGPDTA